MRYIITLRKKCYSVTFRWPPKAKLIDFGRKCVISPPRQDAPTGLSVRVEGVMKDQIDLKGASGALYRFQRLREGHPLSPMGGNWVYVRDEMEGQFKVLCCGEGENLMAGARLRWDEAVSMRRTSPNVLASSRLAFSRVRIRVSPRRRTATSAGRVGEPSVKATVPSRATL